MIEKNKLENINSIIICRDTLHSINDNLVVSPSFIILINNYIQNKLLQEHNDFDNNRIQYLNQKRECSIKKQYNEIIVNLYKDGYIVINNKKYLLKNLYILFNIKERNYHLIDINSEYKDIITESNDDYSYNKSVKFIDTTILTNLIKNSLVNQNVITIDDNNILLDYINKWDGYLHDEIWITDAIKNKNMLKDDDNG